MSLVPVVTESGRLVGINPEEVAGSGYRIASPEEVTAYHQKSQYDTFGQTAAAFGEGALDTLLPGIGSLIEQGLGASPEAKLARAQEHPLARLGGSALAGVGGAMAGVGAPGMFARLGAGAAGALGGGIAGAVAGGATQGFLYSASDIANRAVMRDPRLTGEAALKDMGVATAIGGGLGALGGLAKAFAKDHAEQWAKETSDFTADRTMKALGGIQGDRTTLVKKYGEDGYHQIMREISEHPLRPVGPLTTPKSAYDVAEKMQEQAWDAMKEEMAKAGQAGATVSGDDMLRRFQAIVSEADANPWAEGAAKRLGSLPTAEEPAGSGVLGRYARGLVGKQLSIEDVHAMRKQVSDQIGFARGAVDFDSNLFKGGMHDFRNVMSDSMTEAFDKSDVGSKAWAAANREFQLGKVAQNLAQKGINRSEGNNIVSLTEFLTGGVAALAGGPAGALGPALGHGLIGTAAAAAVRRQASPVLAWVGLRASKALEALATGTESAVTDAVERAFAGAGGIAAAKGAERFTASNYSDMAAKLNRHLVDSKPLLAGLSDPTLDAFAKPVMDEARARALAAVQTVGSALPRYDTVGPLDPAYQPSPTELAQLNRLWDVAQDPVAVLRHLADGTITEDHVSALNAVWPAHAELIRMKALDKLADVVTKGSPVSARLRFGLALVLGRDLGRSTSGPAIAAAQAAYAMKGAQAPQAPPGGAAGPGRNVRNVETRLSKRLAPSTDAERAEIEGRQV